MPTIERVDPLKNFRFRVRYVDGPPFAGVSKITGLKRTTEVIEHRCGGDPTTPYPYPGRTKYEPVTLERGVAVNAHEFEQWANKVWSYRNSGNGLETSLADFRRDLIIDVHDEAGNVAQSYQLFNCWVSEYQPMGDLDANANAVLIQSIQLRLDGWIRDPDTPAPTPSQFDDPVT